MGLHKNHRPARRRRRAETRGGPPPRPVADPALPPSAAGAELVPPEKARGQAGSRDYRWHREAVTVKVPRAEINALRQLTGELDDARPLQVIRAALVLLRALGARQATASAPAGAPVN